MQPCGREEKDMSAACNDDKVTKALNRQFASECSMLVALISAARNAVMVYRGSGCRLGIVSILTILIIMLHT